MVALNAEAAEFFPNQFRKLGHYYFVLSSPPYRELDPFFYYPTAPTTTLPLTSISFHDVVPIPNQPLLVAPPPPEPEPTHYHNMVDTEPSREVVVQQEKEAKASGSKSKGVVKKQVLRAIISGGRMEGQRRSDGLRSLQAYAWRRKGSSEDVVAKDQKCDDLIKNRQIISSEQYFRAFPDQKKRAYPVMPVRSDGDETTVMIRNIPSKYTRDMLVQFLENHCMVENERIIKERDNEINGEENILAFDFVYLPIDFRSGLNKGYAFVNFTNPKAAWKFLITASYRKWDLFLSHKIREVVAARLQGKNKLEKHFETMNFPCESEDVLPVCFSPPRDGVVKGKERTIGKLLKRTQQL